METAKRVLSPARLCLAFVTVGAALAAGACGGGGESEGTAPPPPAPPASSEPAADTGAAEAPPADAGPPVTVRLALDWTPNTNHTGFFVAQEKGYYEDAGIDFKIIPYSNASTDTLVGNGKAECGINFEDFMSIAVLAGTEEKSVMAILQGSPLALMVRADSGITRPSELDGKKYGGFGLPGETEIVRAVIQNDGGSGDFQNVTLNTAAYEAVYNKKVDFSEGYLTWEVIEAKLKNIDLNLFPIADYGIPRFYGVILACSNDWLSQNPDAAKRFVAATVEGWQWAQQNPDEASKILIDANPGVFSNPDLVYQSDQLLAKDYWLDDNGQFGCQTLETWTTYPEFLLNAGVYTDASGNKVTSPPDYSSFFTNDFMPNSCG
jgi:ABC-type nitrate/sulfonate/bicarbonate transport system substrate-binding protein